MILLDSSHPFDWPGFEESIERSLNSLLAVYSESAVPVGTRNVGPVIAELEKFGRQLPASARMLFERDFRSIGQRHGFSFVDFEGALTLRQSFQELEGIARMMGEAFLPIFYIGEGVTAYVYAPKQEEPCADSFVVLVDQLPAGFEYAAFSVGILLSKLGAIVDCVQSGHPERLGRGVPSLMREWLL